MKTVVGLGAKPIITQKGLNEIHSGFSLSVAEASLIQKFMRREYNTGGTYA